MAGHAVASFATPEFRFVVAASQFAEQLLGCLQPLPARAPNTAKLTGLPALTLRFPLCYSLRVLGRRLTAASRGAVIHCSHKN